MVGRVLGVLLVLALGAAGGAAAAHLSEPEPTAAGATTSVSGSSPSVPTVPSPSPSTPRPYADDIAYRTLTTPADYDRLRLVNGLQSWSYVRPAGWQGYRILAGGSEEIAEDAGLRRLGEIRFRPIDEPVQGGYSIRVKAVDQHVLPTSMVEDKLDALEEPGAFEDFTLLEQTDDALYFTYRTADSNRLRYNFFRWYAAPGSSEATLEMSVTGRAIDEPGLRGLLVQFSDRLEPLD